MFAPLLQSPLEKRWLFHDTAATFYGLGVWELPVKPPWPPGRASEPV